MKKRVDVLLTEREIAPSREKAQAWIMAGLVYSDGAKVAKAGHKLDEGGDLEVRGQDHPYVSRGGLKLEGALADFGLDVAGFACMDIGASTGGFTHCLLLKGAARVHAVDVGYGQLAWELKSDPRVVDLERHNIRGLPFEKVGELLDLAVVDASFISLKLIFPEAKRFLKAGGRLLALVKPQFEAGPSEVGRGGLVRDEGTRARVRGEVEAAAVAEGYRPLGWTESPIAGKKSGNVEYFVSLEWPG